MSLDLDVTDDVYSTVSIELSKMFDMLSYNYPKAEQAEHAKLMAEIEISIRDGWEHFKLPK